MSDFKHQHSSKELLHRKKRCEIVKRKSSFDSEEQKDPKDGSLDQLD